MRNTLLALSAVAALAAATPASAQPRHSHYIAPVAGAAAGTVVGLGLYNGWWTNSVGLPTSAAGAAAAGGVAGIGTAALIHAATTPCQGFHAILGGFLTSPEGCVNGQYVGDQPVRVTRRR